MLGKLIASVVEAVVDTAELGVAITKDVVKSPIRALGGDEVVCRSDEGLFHDTREKIKEIKEGEK